MTGSASPSVGGFPAVVMLEPAAGSVGAVPPARTDGSPGAGGALSSVFMDQIGSAFYPPTLLVRAGQPVDFLNSEGVMHNINVTADATGLTVFNIATPPGFESYRQVFDTPGVYRVTCDLHAAMSAFIVVVATPYAAVADADGAFVLDDVPPGTYRASVWSVDASRRVSRAVEIPGGGSTVKVALDAAGVAE